MVVRQIFACLTLAILAGCSSGGQSSDMYAQSMQSYQGSAKQVGAKPVYKKDSGYITAEADAVFESKIADADQQSDQSSPDYSQYFSK
ncbi:MAG: hypothetical protein ACR2QW_17190 [bacterium]